MKVTRKNNNEKSVEELNIGECFLWNGRLFIVTDEDTRDGRRCVNLATGVITYIPESELVTPVDAEVVIND